MWQCLLERDSQTMSQWNTCLFSLQGGRLLSQSLSLCLFNTTLVHFNWRISKDIANHQRAAPQMVQRNPKMLRRVQRQTGKQSPKFTDQEDTYQRSDFLKILNRVQSQFSVSPSGGKSSQWWSGKKASLKENTSATTVNVYSSSLGPAVSGQYHRCVFGPL